MSPDEYRRQALAAAASTTVMTGLLFRSLPSSPDDATFRRFIRSIYDFVMLGRRDVFRLTTEFYNSQRPTIEDPPEFVERASPGGRLEKALEPPRAKLVGLAEFEAEERRLAEEQARAIVEEHVMASGREGVEDATAGDTKALGWVRVPSGDETCAFCMMLASRGPVFKDGLVVTSLYYKSRRTALFKGNGEPYHPHCDCIAVPVFDPNHWPNRERFVEAQRLWNETTGGKTGRAALNALRRHLYAQSSAS